MPEGMRVFLAQKLTRTNAIVTSTTLCEIPVRVLWGNAPYAP